MCSIIPSLMQFGHEYNPFSDLRDQTLEAVCIFYT